MKRTFAVILCWTIFFGTGLLHARNHLLPLDRAPKELDRSENPYGGPANAKAGAKLYRRECSACHGQHGEGSGWAPALNTSRVQKAPPGSLIWVLRNGSIWEGMPSFSHLPEPQMWQIITYLKTLRR